MIENILIVDTETTGLSPEKGSIVIEIAAILFNLKHKCVLQNYSSLLPCNDNPVEHINHISVAMTRSRYSIDWLTNILLLMLDSADACVAHNADFDRKFISSIDGLKEPFLSKKWICTKANFTWPCHLQRFRLEDICNGMKVPYVNAHRALTDCSFLAKCFEKVDDLEERFSRFN